MSIQQVRKLIHWLVVGGAVDDLERLTSEARLRILIRARQKAIEGSVWAMVLLVVAVGSLVVGLVAIKFDLVINGVSTRG